MGLISLNIHNKFPNHNSYFILLTPVKKKNKKKNIRILPGLDIIVGPWWLTPCDSGLWACYDQESDALCYLSVQHRMWESTELVTAKIFLRLAIYVKLGNWLQGHIITWMETMWHGCGFLKTKTADHTWLGVWSSSMAETTHCPSERLSPSSF